MSRNRTLFAVLMSVLLLFPVTAVNASWSGLDGIDGYVYSGGVGVGGITIHVYRGGLLEGYKYGHYGEPAWLGTDVTDANGYFHIAYLYAHGETYVVEAITPCGVLTQTVTVDCGNTVRVDFNCPPPGTGTPGYWKNHPEAWPNEITIGGITYSKVEAIAILWADKNNDKTYTMFAALVAAKLNVLMGNPYGCVADTIDDADAWMALYGPVGIGVTADSDAWKEGEPLYEVLDDYNNGLLCAPARD